MEARSQLRHRPAVADLRPENTIPAYHNRHLHGPREESGFCRFELLTQIQIAVTIERLEGFLRVFRQVYSESMIKAVAPYNSRAQDVSLAHINAGPRHHFAGATPVPLEDFIHELRQPLGVIDSLAYYLELTATDDKSSVHLERIRAMVA